MSQSGNVAGVCRFLLALALPIFLSACSDRNEAGSDADKPLPGVVAQVVTEEDVSDQTDFVGQTRASQRVDIRARVKGTLLKRPFEEGRQVQEGAVLYEIDPAEFKANLLTAEAQRAKAQASYNENERNLERYTTLVEKGSSAVSESQYDIAKSKADQSKAEVSAGDADVERAKLDLGYATITSPIEGRAGISSVDVGNLIGPDSDVLVTVLALDPIDVDFAVGEREYLNYMETVKAGTAQDRTPQIMLANGKLYPHKGQVDIVDNQVDPTTGTISMRLKFPNPDRILLPGQYVNVLLTKINTERQVVIPQAAVQENQAGPFVLVVDSEDRVESRPIKTGSRVGIGVVVSEGLTPGETIVVEGIQKVRPGAEVKVTYQKQSDTPEGADEPPTPDDKDAAGESAPADADSKGSAREDAKGETDTAPDMKLEKNAEPGTKSSDAKSSDDKPSADTQAKN
ncbi:MAG: efflux RND transporter periplasmic adaptor subunit [Methyloceanibacter sp.]|uniref:efflux RND transporter periplasmic adaptor subunit n=1 Tax=Methyloceanibacter sp. TaxID=1965321 RepID=UPI003C3BF9C3